MELDLFWIFHGSHNYFFAYHLNAILRSQPDSYFLIFHDFLNENWKKISPQVCDDFIILQI